MAWIESHTVLLRHRKLLLLATDLSLPPVQLLGHLHALWHTTMEQQEDGNLADWSNQMIAHAAAYSGDADAFVSALQARKWLDGKVVHDWIDYAGRYLTNKYRTANPKKLKAIYKLHQSVLKSDSSQTKVTLKSDNQPNQPDLPNQPTHQLRVRDEFEQIWEAYPRKVGKQRARKSCEKLNGSRPDLDIILAAIARQKQSRAWTKDGGEFIPHLSTWLNDRRWADEVPAVPAVKCAYSNEPCEDPAQPHSKYCGRHGAVIKQAQERRAGSVGISH